MPCDCLIDLERRRVLGRAWGVVTYDDILTARHKFVSDPNFESNFSQLYDGRELTRLVVSASQVGVLAKDDLFDSLSRRAFVAPTREAYELMRLYQTYRQLNAGKEQIRLFRTLEEAESWLDS